MFQLKKFSNILNKSTFQSIFRSYISSISINADTIKQIKIKPDDYDHEAENIRIEAIDGDKNLIRLDDSVVQITKNKDEYHYECVGTKEDTTLIVEVPLATFFSNDVKLKVNVGFKGDIKVDSVPAKSINVFTNNGKVKLNDLRCVGIKATGNQIFADNIYAYSMKLKALGDNSVLGLHKLQLDEFEAEGANIRLDVCYTNKSIIKSTNEAILRTLSGDCEFEAGGKNFNTVSFAGTMNAKLTTERNVLHFVECKKDSVVDISNPKAFVRLAFADEIVKESTNVHITSTCPIATKSRTFVVCQKEENVFEVIRENAGSDSTLKINVDGEKLELIKQSWMDSISFDH